MTSTIADLIAARRGDTVFCSVASGPAITFADIRRHAAGIGAEMVRRRAPDRTVVAVLLPHDGDLVTALLGVMCHAAAAPINPKLSTSEVSGLLVDLRPSMLLTQAGFRRDAEAVARSLGITVIDHRALDEDTGVEPTVAAGDIALVLHTSGTTARPKMVPLTHGNLCASASAVAGALRLSEADRGLAVMPLFHIHGIVGVLLSSLFAGAQIHVSAFDPLTLQRTISASDATWMSAVPTMYQAMLLRPPFHGPTALGAVRSSSAPLHHDTWMKLQERFGCPVVNSYGMTEAAHQIASTGLDHEMAAIGTVGRAAGPEVAVLADDTTIRATGRGEIVIRGAGVTSGYASPAGANDGAFVDGWFRTGDSGSIGSDGLIRLLGRLKEIVNVGGEKVSPFEVDAVLLAHPHVSEAVAFAMPSPLTGEEVHAAVTLCGDTDETQLRRFARERLARFKTPVRIHIVGEIPKSATGKVQRTFLPSQLKL